MNTDSECRLFDSPISSIVRELELTDLNVDRSLLDFPGTSLLVFTSEGCAGCRWARHQLPGMGLPIDRLCWIDAGRNGGAVERYEVFHLPALFVVRNGAFHGALQARLTLPEVSRGLLQALARQPQELP
ncbi:thioredoxin [Pseudomonas akapageensis]|uniref:thioredoxin n=1 Tax=Pseudomonas akapageensis TaxID=2609961 RepID=UPI001407E3A3|nr:thioredoxin [Pseudomonas akapageensis]